MNQADGTDQDELRPEYTAADFAEAIRGKYAGPSRVGRVTLSLECEHQADGRWLAKIAALPGAIAFGDSHDSAVEQVERLAVATLAERVARGDMAPAGLNFAITTICATPRHTPN
jgi:predicted RNase H-like HicB family nuclease